MFSTTFSYVICLSKLTGRVALTLDGLVTHISCSLRVLAVILYFTSQEFYIRFSKSTRHALSCTVWQLVNNFCTRFLSAKCNHIDCSTACFAFHVDLERGVNYLGTNPAIRLNALRPLPTFPDQCVALYSCIHNTQIPCYF